MFGERVFALLLLATLLPFLIVAGGIVVLLSRRCPLVRMPEWDGMAKRSGC